MTSDIKLNTPPKKAIILAANIAGDEFFLESINEVEVLSVNLGWTIEKRFLNEHIKISPAYFFGRGKVEQVKEYISQNKIARVYIGNEISPSQLANLEKEWSIPVIDRTALVLEIFMEHASSHQAKTQVQLALLKYQLPRLTGLWTHLDRERGGSTYGRGMGERQINIDRTLLRSRINQLAAKLDLIQAQHKNQVKNRTKVFQVSLAGYTNVGKSTIINAITAADVKSLNSFFTTLDTTTRVMPSKITPQILVSDTVGFIKYLPKSLLRSFKSTFAVIAEADLILHVCDPSSNGWKERMETSQRLISEISDDRASVITVFNKVDLLSDLDAIALSSNYPHAVLVSQENKASVANLAAKIEEFFLSEFKTYSIVADLENTKLRNYLFANGLVINTEFGEFEFRAQVKMYSLLWERFFKQFPEANNLTAA